MTYFINIRDFIYYNRKVIITVVFFLLLVLIFFFFLKNEETEELKFNDNENFIMDEYDAGYNDDNLKNDCLVVDIKGCVKNPGTYEVTKEMRIIDVINLAGGLLDNSDVSSINLSKKVTDEMVIVIPAIDDNKGDYNDFSFESNNEEEHDSKVSINYGTLEQLMTIKGIGLTKATAIIEYRKEYGLFKSLEEITNVKGIGNTTFEKIKDYIKL